MSAPQKAIEARPELSPDNVVTLQTHILSEERRHPEATNADLAASFQEAVVDVLVTKVVRAARQRGARSAALGGGVAANSRLRERFAAACTESDLDHLVPSRAYCTDNAAMIAAAAHCRLAVDGPTPLDAGNTGGAAAAEWIGGTSRSVLALVTDVPLNVGWSFTAFAEDVTLDDDAGGHAEFSGLPFGSPFTPVGSRPYGYFWINGPPGGDLRLEPTWIRIDFYDGGRVQTQVEQHQPAA